MSIYRANFSLSLSFVNCFSLIISHNPKIAVMKSNAQTNKKRHAKNKEINKVMKKLETRVRLTIYFAFIANKEILIIVHLVINEFCKKGHYKVA